MLNVNACPICGNTSSNWLYVIAPVGPCLRVHCETCNTVYLSGRIPDPPVYDFKYNLEFFRPGDIEKAKIMAPKIEQAALSISKKPRILEVGVGNGLTLRELVQLDYDAEGVDLDPELSKYLKGNYGIKVTPGGLLSFNPGRKFHLIYSSHVIEHFQDPNDFMENVARLQERKSILYLDSPDVDLCPSLDPNWHHFKTRNPYEHACVLSRQSLTALGLRHGYFMLRFDQFPQFGSFQAIMLYD